MNFWAEPRKGSETDFGEKSRRETGVRYLATLCVSALYAEIPLWRYTVGWASLCRGADGSPAGQSRMNRVGTDARGLGERPKGNRGCAVGEDATSAIRIGISSCLLGEHVRYDGGHKRDRFLTDVLARYVEWVPVCPEVELGMGTPREPVRLEASNAGPRMVTVKTRIDHTEAMRTFARRRANQLADERLSGYVLKKDSPSCGMQRVKLYRKTGVPSTTGRGLFAAALLERLPQLPVEEEGRLCDPKLRENFIERVFAYHRLQDLFASRCRLGDLVGFHTAHKLQLMAHSPRGYRSLGRLVAEARSLPRRELRARYEADFMGAMRKTATPGRHVNVMYHILGYFKKQLDADSRAELLRLIEDYRRELVPLIIPMTLLRHYVRRFDVSYIGQQTYLEPHPKELMLRNHA